MEQRRGPKSTNTKGPIREGSSRGLKPVGERDVATRAERAEQIGEEKRDRDEPIE